VYKTPKVDNRIICHIELTDRYVRSFYSGSSQALDVSPVALDDINEVIHVAVLLEQDLCVVYLVLLAL
jgi:hypothetical protein